MPIRITGMNSGLDTESIITELVSAQSAKKNSLVKAQTKLSWKKTYVHGGTIHNDSNEETIQTSVNYRMINNTWYIQAMKYY